MAFLAVSSPQRYFASVKACSSSPCALEDAADPAGCSCSGVGGWMTRGGSVGAKAAVVEGW
eukprot:14551137-Alexandrium_andersonii.AAC.1